MSSLSSPPRRSPSVTGRLAAALGLALVLAGAGCASSGPGGVDRDSDRDLITQEEIAALDVNTAYEVIERLRPRWLRVRASRSHNRPTEVVVLVDNLRLEGIQSLWDVDAPTIASIRWLDSAQAGQLPGLGSRHVEGAILIETR